MFKKIRIAQFPRNKANRGRFGQRFLLAAQLIPKLLLLGEAETHQPRGPHPCFIM